MLATLGGVEAGSWAGGWVARLPPTPTIGRKLAAARSWVWDQEVTRAGNGLEVFTVPGEGNHKGPLLVESAY